MKRALIAAILMGMLSTCAAEPSYAQFSHLHTESCVSVAQYEKGENLKDWFTIHTEGSTMTVELFAPDGPAADQVTMVLFEDGCFKQKLSRPIPIDLPLNAAIQTKMDITVH